MRKVETAISLESGHKKPSLSKVEISILEVEIKNLYKVFGSISEVEISILEIEITIFAMVLFQLDVSCMVPLFVQVRK